MTNTGTPPPHGTAGRYRGTHARQGCHCHHCARAARTTPTPRTRTRRDATGATRRVRALYAIGHGPGAVAAAAAMSRQAVSDLAAGRYVHVSASIADRLATAYTQMMRAPGQSRGAIAAARRHGWHGPLAWDRIDDPASEPEADQYDPTPRYISLAEDWSWLQQQGYSRTQAAARLGVSRDALEASISRYAHRYGAAA